MTPYEVTAEIMFERIVDIESKMQTNVQSAFEVDSRHVLVNRERIFKFTGKKIDEVKLEDLTPEAREAVLEEINL